MKNTETENIKIPALFPYQIKNRENFLFQEHPKQLHPDSPLFDRYWGDFEKKMIEGVWVNDEGTWVYMMPKLFFYINYAKVEHRDRSKKHPTLRDNEWIIFTYLLCCEGFSGFELDEEYTCHDFIERYEKSKDESLPDKVRRENELDAIEYNAIPDSAKKPDGSFKKYINPWYYLTRHYLIDNPPDKPLGKCLYENEIKNACILSARGIGKSFTTFVGDFLHEWLTSGIKSVDDLDKVNNRALFGMGSAKAPQLQRSIDNISSCYHNLPGQYEFADDKKPTYMGPFYKKVQGSWEVGKRIQHVVKKKNRTTDIDGSSLQMVALTKDATTIGAGDRFRRIYVEEFGFLANAIDVHGANKDSLQSMGRRVGMSVYLGTGGDMQAIRQPKNMFESPDAYDIFGIPNYWKNEKKKIGLFVPAYYALDMYKDKNGNSRIGLAYDAIMKKREKDKKEKDSISFELDIMFNPVKPEEMLRPSSGGVLPKQEASEQLANIEAFDIFRRRAQIGRLQWNPQEKYGVEWRKDMTSTLRPIMEWGKDDNKINKEGAIVIYEQPPENIPTDLYWVVYDPAKQSGDAQSFHSVLVYKYFYVGSEKTWYDTIVAEWIGRKETLEQNYEMVIRIAKYFNAKIFPEINVAGFVEWCKNKDYYDMLEPDAYQLEQEIHGHKAIKRSYYQVGFQMQTRRKSWALRKLRDWLLEVKEIDPVTGAPILRTMDWIISPRILNEIIAYSDDPDENFDHISSLLGLMLLIGKLNKQERDPPNLDKDIEDEKIDSVLVQHLNREREQSYRPHRRQRCTFLKY